MKVRAVHNVLEFSQSFWLKNFIDYAREKRKNASNEFEARLYKQVAVTIFGKFFFTYNRYIYYVVNRGISTRDI